MKLKSAVGVLDAMAEKVAKEQPHAKALKGAIHSCSFTRKKADSTTPQTVNAAEARTMRSIGIREVVGHRLKDIFDRLETGMIDRKEYQIFQISGDVVDQRQIGIARHYVVFDELLNVLQYVHASLLAECHGSLQETFLIYQVTSKNHYHFEKPESPIYTMTYTNRGQPSARHW